MELDKRLKKKSKIKDLTKEIDYRRYICLFHLHNCYLLLNLWHSFWQFTYNRTKKAFLKANARHRFFCDHRQRGSGWPIIKTMPTRNKTIVRVSEMLKPWRSKKFLAPMTTFNLFFLFIIKVPFVKSTWLVLFMTSSLIKSKLEFSWLILNYNLLKI